MKWEVKDWSPLKFIRPKKRTKGFHRETSRTAMTQNSVKEFDNKAYQNDNQNNRHSDVFTRSESFYDTSLKYGWGRIDFQFLQIFNKPVAFLVVLSFVALFQGMVATGVTFTSFTSVEKQFGYKSTEVALFGTFYDIAGGVCCLIVGYVGYRHKPRWLGWGTFVLAIGTLLYSFPKYLFGDYIVTSNIDTEICLSKGNGTNNKLEYCRTSSEWYYKAIFILSQSIMGIGATPIYTLGVAHLDEITTRGQNSIYMGVFFSFAALGPGLGYLIGLPVLDTWVDIKQPYDGIQLTPEDNNWIGAWWLGFVIGAVLLLLPVIPMLGFPRLFPNAEILKENKKSFEDTVEEDHNLKHDFKSIWPATKALLKNKPFMLICLASASESLAVGGFSTFLPKLIETQFDFTASNASFYTGVIVIPGVAGGIFVGGYVIKRLNWSCKKTLRGSTLFAFLAALLIAFFFVGCDGSDITGAQIPYPGIKTNEISLVSACNQNCSCSVRYYEPICSKEDQRTYFTGCHAGCLTKVGKVYRNCACFPANVTIAEEGRCTPECNLFPLFAIGAFCLFFFTFLNNVPMINATLRVVPEGQGSFAMGFQQVFVRFLGYIPAPTLFGSFVDKSCKLWQIDECTGDKTSCLEYFHDDFRYYLASLGFITKFLSFLFIFGAYLTYKLPVNTFRLSQVRNASYSLDQMGEDAK